MIKYKEKYWFDTFMGGSIQYFLDWFYTNGISFHMLITQHTFLFGGGTNPAHPKHIGSINLTCDAGKLVKDAYGTAKRLCKLCYLVDPELKVEDFSAKTPDKCIQEVYVLSHAIQELKTTAELYEEL